MTFNFVDLKIYFPQLVSTVIAENLNLIVPQIPEIYAIISLMFSPKISGPSGHNFIRMVYIESLESTLSIDIYIMEFGIRCNINIRNGFSSITTHCENYQTSNNS